MKNNKVYGKSGQTLVEFALAIPVLLLLSVVIFDLGRAVYYSSAVNNAAREGARYGIVFPDDTAGIEQAAKDYAIGLGVSDIDVDIAFYLPENIEIYPPPSITVTVIYDFIPATPLVSEFLPGNQITITGEADMKLEALPSP